MAITYQTGARTINRIYRATSGGTVFSSDFAGSASFGYFDDAAVVDDAIYFGFQYDCSKITFNIGTALSGTDVVIKWEYYQRDLSTYGGTTAGWYEIPSQSDETVGFTVTGSQSFKFGLPYGWSYYTVNGAGYLWIRARIVSLTAITEGGANWTSAVSAKDADVNIDGYSDVSPCTLADIHSYLTTNAPWLNIPKRLANTKRIEYDFREIVLDVNSRLLCQNEKLDIGFMGYTDYHTGTFDLSYLQMGTPLGDEFGINGCVLMIHGPTNSHYHWVTATTTEFYATLIDGLQGFGYTSWKCKSVFCYYRNVCLTPDPAGIMINCMFTSFFFMCRSGFFGTFNKCKVVTQAFGTLNCSFLFYSASSTTFEDFDYTFDTPASAILLSFWIALPYPTTEYVFLNPVTPLPDQTSYPCTVGLTYPASRTTAKAWFYNSTAGTYTDITTEINSSETLNDVPVCGEVGDCVYINQTDSTISNGIMVWSSLASNDYEYVWEYYNSIAGGWVQYDSTTYQNADNFTKSYSGDRTSGFIYLYRDGTYPTSYSVAVNGYTGYWHRLRITKKGTGSPYVHRLSYFAYRGMELSNVYEKYSLDLKVVDESGDAIEDAQVDITLNGASIFSDVTDSSGEIETQNLTYKRFNHDPITYPSTQLMVKVTTSDSYVMTVAKQGYETYHVEFPMNKKRAEIIELKTWRDVVTTNKGMGIKVDPTNSTVDRDVVVIP